MKTLETEPGVELTHLDAQGRARMVDVSDKPVSRRQAVATGSIYLGDRAFPLLAAGQLKKGDALATARIAGIMAVKNTASLIPLCHPLPLTGIEVDFALDSQRRTVDITVRVKTLAPTGVEMEALTGVAAAALTIYDMCKAVDRDMVIGQIRLREKTGGKSGDYHAPSHPSEA